MARTVRTPARRAGVTLSPEFHVVGEGGEHVFPGLAQTAEFLDRRVSSFWNIARVVRPGISALWHKGESDKEEYNGGTIQINGGVTETTIPIAQCSGRIGIMRVHEQRCGVAPVDLRLVPMTTLLDNLILSSGGLQVFTHSHQDTIMQATLRAEHGLNKQGIESTLDWAFAVGQEFVGAVLLGEELPMVTN